MNIKNTLLIIITASIFLLSSCAKDFDSFIPDPGQVTGPDSTWYATLNNKMPIFNLKSTLQLPFDIDSFTVSNTSDTINTTSGLQCIFPAQAFVDSNNVPVNGKVFIQSQLITTKGNIVRADRPSSTIAGDLLQTQGAFYVHATKNDTSILLASGKQINVSYSNTNTLPINNIFLGDNTNIEQYNWIKNTDQVNNNFSVSAGKSQVFVDSLNWVNCATVFDTTVTTNTTIAASLPSTFTNFNTVVYLVFNDMQIVTGMYGSATEKMFISHRVPVGKSVTIVTITKEGNFYYLGHVSVTTTVPSTSNKYQLVTITPTRITIDDIKNYLAGL